MSRTYEVKQLRHFGYLVGGVFGVIGLWPLLWRQQPPRWWALALAALLVVPALVAPRVLAPVYRLWMALGEVLAWVNTRIILGVVFYGVVTPIGLVMRLFGHDPMRRRLRQSDASYRIRSVARPATHMTRQF